MLPTHFCSKCAESVGLNHYNAGMPTPSSSPHIMHDCFILQSCSCIYARIPVTVGLTSSLGWFSITCQTCHQILFVTADIVSHWTWAATLLQSSNQAYQYGVSGPFWYAGGATIQIILFGILAVQIKMKAPSAHTVLEIVHARWGNTAHLVFFFFCFLTNIIVSAMLILGGAAVMTALTGMNTIAVRLTNNLPSLLRYYTVMYSNSFCYSKLLNHKRMQDC